jgi:hypothetical protein
MKDSPVVQVSKEYFSTVSKSPWIGVDSSKDPYLHTTAQHRRMRVNIHHTLRGIRTHDTSIHAVRTYAVDSAENCRLRYFLLRSNQMACYLMILKICVQNLLGSNPMGFPAMFPSSLPSNLSRVRVT